MKLAKKVLSSCQNHFSGNENSYKSCMFVQFEMIDILHIMNIIIGSTKLAIEKKPISIK